jgi:SAM-dependent methyltransferase
VANAKSDVVEIICGYYQGLLLQGMYKSGVIGRLRSYVSVEQLSADLGICQESLAASLEFLYQTSDVLDRSERGEYALRKPYARSERLGFLWRKFIAAYGNSIYGMFASGPSKKHVDMWALAQAFAEVSTPPRVLVDVIISWEVATLVDLGCGVGSLLIELARRNPQFIGWGLDQSKEMCAIAAERAANARCEERLSFCVADVRSIKEHMSRAERDAVRAVYGSSIINEFFSHGASQAVEFVEQVRSLFPGRLLFVVDYYGKLLHSGSVDRRFRHTLLQDLVQAATGQGVPPQDLSGWCKVYEEAGSRLLYAYQSENDGIEWFIHVVKL